MMKALSNGNKTFNCPYCQELYFEYEIDGEYISCSVCGRSFVVPEILIDLSFDLLDKEEE